MEQHQPIQEEIPSINNFKLDDDEFDIISFYKNKEGFYKFLIAKITEEQKDYEMTDMGQKFLMLFVTGDTYEVNEAILGDPVYIVRNFVKAQCEGMIIKKCKKGLELVDRLIKKSELNRLAKTLNAYVETKEASIV